MRPIMSPIKLVRTTLIVGAFLALTGCVSDPLTSAQNGDLEAITQNPKQYQAQTFRLGGQILSVNTLGELTEIEVLALPLNSRGRPTGNFSKGRFLVIIKTPTDIYRYTENALITVTGSVSGLRDVPSGHSTVQQVIFHANEQVVWSDRQERTANKAPLGFKTIGSGAPNPGFGFTIPLKPR